MLAPKCSFHRGWCSWWSIAIFTFITVPSSMRPPLNYWSIYLTQRSHPPTFGHPCLPIPFHCLRRPIQYSRPKKHTKSCTIWKIICCRCWRIWRNNRAAKQRAAFSLSGNHCYWEHPISRRQMNAAMHKHHLWQTLNSWLKSYASPAFATYRGPSFLKTPLFNCSSLVFVKNKFKHIFFIKKKLHRRLNLILIVSIIWRHICWLTKQLMHHAVTELSILSISIDTQTSFEMNKQ